MTARACADPAHCPVPDPDDQVIGRATLTTAAGGLRLERVYSTVRPSASFNASGIGSTRFAPLLDDAEHPVEHLYAASRRTVALLETVFHDVHEDVPRIVYEATDLGARGLVGVTVQHDLRVVDLRDSALAALGLQRRELVATAAAHYPCTREWAAALRHGMFCGEQAAGLLWHSRVAELAHEDSHLLDDLLHGEPAEVLLLWGDRAGAGSIVQAGPPLDDLVSGPGRLLVDQVATQLDAEIH